MNRRFFISSSIAVGGVAVLSRLPLLFQLAQGNDGKIISGGSDVSPHPSPFPEGEGGNRQGEGAKSNSNPKSKGIKKVIKTDAEWKSQLTPEQYNVLRQKGTEYAFTSPLTDIHDKGIFECAGCELPYSVRNKSLIRAPAGRVSGHQSSKKM